MDLDVNKWHGKKKKEKKERDITPQGRFFDVITLFKLQVCTLNYLPLENDSASK